VWLGAIVKAGCDRAAVGAVGGDTGAVVVVVDGTDDEVTEGFVAWVVEVVASVEVVTASCRVVDVAGAPPVAITAVAGSRPAMTLAPPQPAARRSKGRERGR
jgi:hypothetical protein